MTTFDLLDRTPTTLALGELLVRHGANPAIRGELLLVEALSIEQARERLGRLTEAERARTLLVGLSGSLEGGQFPTPDSLAGVLDNYAPLGVLASAVGPWRPEFAGFIGKRSLAEAVGSSCFKLSTSDRYGSYMRCTGQDAGAFVLRYLRAAMTSSALPGDAYLAYLRIKDRRTCAQSLDDALVAADLADEAMLWRAWCAGESHAALTSGPWRDRAVHLGVSPPHGATTGDLWFDVCEVALMVHAGRAWLATRPTAGWQMRGFLGAASRASREVQVRPPHTALDPDRLLEGRDDQTAGDLTSGEATLYACWFGKTVPDLLDWQAAAEHLPPEQVKALLSDGAKEWTSMKFADDEAARVFVTPTTINEDPREIAKDKARAVSMIAGEYTHKHAIGFRTSVLVERGLLRGAPSSQPIIEGIALTSLLDRSSFR
jgi:hypothetical protein